MRSALFKLALFLAVCAAARAQVNPHTQIRWPVACAGDPHMTYNWQTNNCVQAGPVGNSGEVQFNQSGAWNSIPAFNFNLGTQTLNIPNLAVSGTSAITIPPTQMTWPAGCTASNYVSYNATSNTCFDVRSNFTAGSTSTLPAGTPATVNVSGTFPNFVFNFGIPAGIPGSSLSYPGVASNGTNGLNMGGASLPSGFIPGTLVAPASYNPNQGIDVVAAGALGDCVHDDHNAIMLAQAISILTSTGQQPLPLKFPRPPGGVCYLTSTLTWQGVSEYGEVSTQGNNVGGNVPVQLRSMPGQDLWNYPDPNDQIPGSLVTVASKGPVVQNMVWMMDDTIDASSSHPHRKPGRTTQDGVTYGTNVSQAGTITTTAGGTIVTGVGTSFLTIGVAQVGAKIIAGGETHTIIAISSATVLITDAWTGANAGVSWATNSGAVITSAKMGCALGDVGQGATATYPDTTSQSVTITSCAYGGTTGGQFGLSMTVAGATPVATTTATLGQQTNTIVVASATGIATGQIALVPSFPGNVPITVTNVAGTTITLSGFNNCKTNCALGTVSAKFYDPTFVMSEAQSGVTLYISLADIPVTATIGNCALALDNRDALTANWKNPTNNLFSYAQFRDFAITTLHNDFRNNTGGFCLQGAVALAIGTMWNNMRITGVTYGLTTIPFDTNSTNASGIGFGGDFDGIHDSFLGGAWPLIWYDGQGFKTHSVQVAGAHGPQIMSAWSTTYPGGGPFQFELSIPEMEQNTPGSVGMRLEGIDHVVTNTTIAATGSTAVWDASFSKCISCNPRGLSGNNYTQIQMGGMSNQVEDVDNINQHRVIDDPILGNQVTALRSTNPPSGFRQFTRPSMVNQGRPSKSLAVTSDFSIDSLQAPYLNRDDLWEWSQDFFMVSGSHPATLPDPSLMNGYYAVFPTNFEIAGNSGWFGNGYQIGTNIPAKQITVAVRTRCPVISSWIASMKIRTVVAGGTVLNTFASQPVTCSTTWATRTFVIDLSTNGAWVGAYLSFASSQSGEVHVGWVDYLPVPPVNLSPQWSPATLYSAAGTALPTCNAAAKGTVSVVSDATTLNGTYTSGGSNSVPVICSGTTWLILATGTVSAGGVADVDVTVPVLTSIPANTCWGSTGSTTPATFTQSGLTTAMGIRPMDTGNPSAIAGWGATGGLNIRPWASGANTGSYVVCNTTASTITSGSIVIRMGAQ